MEFRCLYLINCFYLLLGQPLRDSHYYQEMQFILGLVFFFISDGRGLHQQTISLDGVPPKNRKMSFNSLYLYLLRFGSAKCHRGPTATGSVTQRKEEVPSPKNTPPPSSEMLTLLLESISSSFEPSEFSMHYPSVIYVNI